MSPQFDTVAWGYDFFMRMWRMYMDDLILGALDLKGDELIADFGGGTGHYAGLISSHCRQVTVVDESAAMLSHVPKAANITTLLSDIRSTGLPSEHYDAVLLTDVIHHVSDQQKVLAEAHRVLKSGGRLLILDFNARDVRIRMLGIFEWILFKRIYYKTPDQMTALFFESGFADVTCNPCGWYYLIAGCKA